MNSVDIRALIKIAFFMIAIDAVWISLVAGKSFSKMTENIQRSPMIVRPLGAIVAYVAMTLLFFTFRNDLTLVKAFLLGSLAYAIYDFTNYALFSNWKLETAIIDVIWGGTLFALVKLFTDMIQ